MASKGRAWRRITPVLVLALLGACGGGGEAAAPTTPPATPPSTPPVTPPATPSRPTLTASTYLVTAQAQGAEATSITQTVQLTLQSPNPEGVALGGIYTVDGILTSSLTWNGFTGSLAVTFRPGNTLPPGVYNDTITIRVCSALPCTTEVGDRRTIAVQYTVIEAPVLVSFSKTTFSVSGNNVAWHAAIEELVPVTISRGYTALWTRTTIAGSMLTHVGVSLSLPPGDTGNVQLTLRPPSTLGAGTYTDSVRVEICLNASCTRQAIGSPVTMNVTYIITGSALPTTTIHWSPSFLTGADLITTETRSPKMTLTLVPSEQVFEGIYARHSSSATGLIAGVVEREVSAGGSQLDARYGLYDVSLKSPAALGSGVFTDTMEFEACFDAACTMPVPNSRYTLTLRVIVTTTEGVEFTRRTLPSSSSAQGVVWSSATQSLYVDASAGAARQIIPVDPLTMIAGAGVTLPETGLRNMTVTADGTYLYVGSRTGSFVRRVQLPSLVNDLTVSLGTVASGAPLKVNDLAMLPGQPQSFVVAREFNNGNHAGVVVYDDATMRSVSVGTNPAQGFEQARWLVPAATSGNFVSLNYGPSQPVVNQLEQLAVSASGISVASTVVFPAPDGIRFFPKPQRIGNRLFLNSGAVLDTATGALVGMLAGIDSGGASTMLADEARGLVFALTRLDDQKVYLVSYDSATLRRLALVPYTGNSSFPAGSATMTLWGQSGMAIADGAQLVVLSGPFFSTYRGEPTQ